MSKIIDLEKPLTVEEAAAFTGYSVNYIYNLINQKKIPFYKPRNGRVFFKPRDLHNFIYRDKSNADYEVKQQAEKILTGGKK